MGGTEDGPVLHTQVWPLPPAGVVLEPEPEPEVHDVWRLDARPAPRTPTLCRESAAPKMTEQVWPLRPRIPSVPDLDSVSAIFDPTATPGSFGALPGSRGAGSRAYDTWLDHSTSAIFLSEILSSPAQCSSGPARAQTPDMGPARTSALSMLQRVKMQRPAANHPRAAEQAERPWTAERFEVLSEGRSVRVIGNTTGALQMSVPLENELRRTAMDYVSRQAVRRKAAARKRLGLRLQQSTVPQQGVAFGSTVGGSMRWTAQRSSNSRCSISSLASSSQGSVGLRSPRRAATPDGGLAGQATTLPGPSAGWFLPLSPHSDAESSPGRDSLRSRGSVGSSNATVECELLDKRPVLIQASQPQLSARTGRQSPRHGASVRYVKSPREKRQGTGRDPSRSHLSGKGVGTVSRYRVLDKVIEVHAEPAPETPMIPSADGTSIQATQSQVTQPPSAASLVVRHPGPQHVQPGGDALALEPGSLSRVRIPATAATAVRMKGAQRPRQHHQRRHLGQRPPPGHGQFAPGAVILDEFRSTSKRPVMVQLAQRKQK